MYTERLAIQDSLRDIERRMDELEKEKMELRTDRKLYIQRLREIDDRDMKSNSIDTMEHLTSTLTDVVGQISKIIPDIPASTWMEHFQKTNEIKPSIIENTSEQTQEPIQAAVQAAAQEQQLQLKPHGKDSKEQNAAIIKQIIEDNGPLVSLQVIENEFIKRTNIRYKAFSPQVTSAMDIFPSIKRIGRGKFTVDSQPLFVEGGENPGPETAVN